MNILRCKMTSMAIRNNVIRFPGIDSIAFWSELDVLHRINRYEPHRDKTNKMACAPSEDSDQPGHPPSLIRVFAVRLKKARILSYPLSVEEKAQRFIPLGSWFLRRRHFSFWSCILVRIIYTGLTKSIFTAYIGLSLLVSDIDDFLPIKIHSKIKTTIGAKTRGLLE